MRGRGRSSGGETLDTPAPAGTAAIDDTIVQAVVAALPEFNRVGREAVTSPVRWTRYGAGILAREGRDPALEGGAAGYLVALGRSPSRQLAAARAGGEVLVRFPRSYLRHSPVHPYLLLESPPVEDQAGACIARELAALVAAVVGVEHEAVRVEPFQQHHAHRRMAGGGRGRKRDGVGQRLHFFERALVPPCEQRDRVAFDGSFAQWLAHIRHARNCTAE